MITTFDRLIYASAMYSGVHTVYKHMLDALQSVRLSVINWPEWPNVYKYSLDVDPAMLWKLAPMICLCTANGVVPGMYRPMIVDGTEGSVSDLQLDTHEWLLDAVMVFRRSSVSFDVIPLMTNVRADKTPFPEIQLRYTATDKGWAWRQSPVGFVNVIAYGDILGDLAPACQKRIDDAVQWLGGYILAYLGSYDKFLTTPGTWKVIAAKPPRYKEHNGKVRKIHDIAQAGYRQYVHSTQ
jgi:hypothetical protein